MQVYLSFSDDIYLLINKASYQHKLRFALDICKELYLDFENFTNSQNEADKILLKTAMEVCEKSLANEKVEDVVLTDLIEKTSKIEPDSKGFSVWKTSYAINASQSIHDLLMFMKDSNNEHISDICSFMIDTTDFKIAESNSTISDDGIFKHPVMVQTMKQLKEKIKEN
jgi:uncharacterized protein YjaG (DUF416 family)